MSYAQTKCRDDCPWCGDDVDALGLGPAMILVMRGAISAPHHGCAIFWAYCEAEVGVLTLRRSYIGFGEIDKKSFYITPHNRV